MNTWPEFWNHIPEGDRPVIRSIVTELLSTGVLFGDIGRAREMFLVAREFQKELEDYLSVVGLDLVIDPEQPILQARPAPGDCGLTAKFSKDETLTVLTLWRIYDEMRMDQASEVIVITVNELYARLKLYFEKMTLPLESPLKETLNKFRQRRFIRMERDDAKFGDSRIEILPTLARAIPFDSPADWAEHADLFRAPEAEQEPGTETTEQ